MNDSNKIDVGLVNRCVKCKAEFTAADIREIDDDVTRLDYHCPACGYHFARWPKHGITIGYDRD